MGLFTGLLTLPLAPVRGTVWIAEQLAAEAERERVALFDDAMNELAQEQAERMHFKYLGPLAPHSFVGLTAEAR